MEKRATQDNYIDLVDTGQFLVVEEVFAAVGAMVEVQAGDAHRSRS